MRGVSFSYLKRIDTGLKAASEELRFIDGRKGEGR
jgi:hypothetical protein